MGLGLELGCGMTGCGVTGCRANLRVAAARGEHLTLNPNPNPKP